MNHNIAWIKRYLAVLPNPDLYVEVGKFDMAKILNPQISGKQYQEGRVLRAGPRQVHLSALPQAWQRRKARSAPYHLQLTGRNGSRKQSDNALHGLPHDKESSARRQALQMDESQEESDEASERRDVHEHFAQADDGGIPRSKLSVWLANLR